MSAPLPFRNNSNRKQDHDDWPADRLAEARAVIADVVHHSDPLIRLACHVLVRHGETEAERREARALLLVIDARCPARHRHARRDDPDDAPEVQP